MGREQLARVAEKRLTDTPARPITKEMCKSGPVISRIGELKSGSELGPQDFLGPEALRCFGRSSRRMQ